MNAYEDGVSPYGPAHNDHSPVIVYTLFGMVMGGFGAIGFVFTAALTIERFVNFYPDLTAPLWLIVTCGLGSLLLTAIGGLALYVSIKW